MHTDERTILIDEAIHPRRALPLRNTHHGESRRGECTAHEFPVAAVRGGKDRPASIGDSRAQLLHRPRKCDIRTHAWVHNREAQHLHKHWTEAQTARACNTLRLRIRNAEAARNLLLGEYLAARGDEVPRKPRQPFTECHRRTMWQEADEEAQSFHRIVGEHLSPSRADPRAPFREILFFSPSQADGESLPVRAATPYAAARESPHRRRPRAYLR